MSLRTLAFAEMVDLSELNCSAEGFLLRHLRKFLPCSIFVTIKKMEPQPVKFLYYT